MANGTLSVVNAGNLGAMMGEELQNILELQGNIKEEQKRSYVLVLWALRQQYQDAVDNFPEPGSRAKTHGKNILLDFHTDGAGKEVSWYGELFDASPLGKRLAKELEEWQAAKGEKNEVEYVPEEARIKARRTNEINVIKNAVKLNRQLMAVNTRTEAEAKIIPGADGKPTRSHKNIFLYHPDDRMKFKLYTTGQFLALDVDKAMEKEGTYDALIGTTGRGAGNGAGGKDAIKNINTPDQFEVTVYRAVDYFKTFSDDKERNKFLKKLNEAGSDELIMAMDWLATDLEKFLGMPSVSKRRNELHEAGGYQAVIARKAQAA